VQYQLLQAVLELTTQCNFHCLHCGSDCDQSVDSNELSIVDWQNCLVQLAKLGTCQITFSGGESVLHKGFEQLIVQAAQVGLKYGIITNGSGIHPALLEVIARYKPFAVGFSLDGLEATHNYIRQHKNSYGMLMATVVALQQRKIPVTVVTTLNKMNIVELDALMEVIVDAGFSGWQIQLSMPFGRMSQHRDWLINQEEFQIACAKIIQFRVLHPHIKIEAADCFGPAPADMIRDDEQFGCGAGIVALGIDAYGNVLPCLSFRGAASCGNIRQKSLQEIWQFSSGFDFNRQFQSSRIGQNCRGCRLVTTCRGGCASNSVAYTGEPHNSPFCFLRSFYPVFEGGEI